MDGNEQQLMAKKKKVTNKINLTFTLYYEHRNNINVTK